MQTKRNYPILQTIRWSSDYLLAIFIYSSIIVGCFELAHMYYLRIPWLPMSVIGIAVAFFLGFKNNASYDRQWEARKIYGAIVNTSRSWGMSVRDFVSDTFLEWGMEETEIKKIHQELIHRHIAWLTALRHQLRRKQTWEHQKRRKETAYFAQVVPEYLTTLENDLKNNISEEELATTLSKANAATHLLASQSAQLKELRKQGLIDDFRHMKLQELLIDLFAQQGKCERIKNYPFPRQYATFNLIAVWIFVILLPLGMIDTFNDINIWLAIPFSTVIGWIFFTMELVGDYSENPFEGGYNDIPITTLSRTIEVDLRQMLEEEEMPAPVETVNGIMF